MLRMRYRARKIAFTLAELLIALAILGVIATFTIPYTEKYVDASNNNYVYYQLHNGVVVGVYGLGIDDYESGKYDLEWLPDVWVDATIAKVRANQVTTRGVDGNYFETTALRSGILYLSYNQWLNRTGAPLNPVYARVTDWKDHPDWTCASAAVGGANCGW